MIALLWFLLTLFASPLKAHWDRQALQGVARDLLTARYKLPIVYGFPTRGGIR
jgi:hypothetical protein